MNLARVDLNLLVYLDVLLRECSVTRAAEQLNITQPAMSNGLRRLRDLFDDPLLIRTSEGMRPTARALELQPQLREVLSKLEVVVQSSSFTATFGRYAWKDSYTPDDDLGALVPLEPRKGSGKRQLGLTDANGVLHECVAEAFTNKQQVFVLILVRKSLTATHVLFGQMAVPAM